MNIDDIYFKDCFTKIDIGINYAFKRNKYFYSLTNIFCVDCEGIQL